MAHTFNLEKIEIGLDTLSARVRLTPQAPLMTSQDLEATTRIYQLMPHIIEHACLGDVGETFKDCMGDTEVAHLLEHMVVEILAQTRRCGDISTGRTSPCSQDGRSFLIEISCVDDVLCTAALSSALWIVDWAFNGGGEPVPNVAAIVEGIISLVDSLGEEPAQAYEQEVSDEMKRALQEELKLQLEAYGYDEQGRRVSDVEFNESFAADDNAENTGTIEDETQNDAQHEAREHNVTTEVDESQEHEADRTLATPFFANTILGSNFEKAREVESANADATIDHKTAEDSQVAEEVTEAPQNVVEAPTAEEATTEPPTAGEAQTAAEAQIAVEAQNVGESQAAAEPTGEPAAVDAHEVDEAVAEAIEVSDAAEMHQAKAEQSEDAPDADQVKETAESIQENHQEDLLSNMQFSSDEDLPDSHRVR